MGASGLIVVVIVAAWALFLVPQWMHRRASAAAHLADRIAESPAESDLDDRAEHDDAGSGTSSQTSRRARRFGRRHLTRRPAPQPVPGRFTRLLARGRAKRRGDEHVAPARSAAARRRRVLAVLALSTLLTAVVVAVAAVAGLPVPAWLVAVPGGLMIGYLALLAVLRPGSHAPVRATARSSVPSRTDTDEAAADTVPALAAVPVVAAAPTDEPAVPTAEAVPSEPVHPESTWTPVPVPTPTYVTAPRARRAVRTIDLSNPGSWASVTRPAASAGAGVDVDDEHVADAGDYVLEHKRAVGD